MVRRRAHPEEGKRFRKHTPLVDVTDRAVHHGSHVNQTSAVPKMGRFFGVRRIGRVDATYAGTLVPIVREADQIQNSRGDRTSIELFLTSLNAWSAALLKMVQELGVEF